MMFINNIGILVVPQSASWSRPIFFCSSGEDTTCTAVGWRSSIRTPFRPTSIANIFWSMDTTRFCGAESIWVSTKMCCVFPRFFLNHQKKNGSLAIGVHESWVFNHGHLRTLMVGSLPFDGIKWELEDQRAAMGCWSHDPYVYGASMRIRGICISGWFACPILGILDITL